MVIGIRPKDLSYQGDSIEELVALVDQTLCEQTEEEEICLLMEPAA